MSKQNRKKESSNDQRIKQFSLEISKLSYEESLKELDFILNELQNETLQVDQLKYSYLKAKLYLQHCEKLLDSTEQELIQIDDND